MRNSDIILLKSLYVDHLEEINNIKFTQREIDVISFFISGRSAKKTASSLSIASKTVEFHTRNITEKLGCNSREGVIDFIEKSKKMPFARQYYASMLAYKKFEEDLQKIISLNTEKNYFSVIIYCPSADDKNLALYLKTFLEIAEINVIIEQGQEKFITTLLDNSQKQVYRFYLVSKNLEEELENFLKDNPLPNVLKNSLSFLFSNEESFRNFSANFKKIKCIQYNKKNNQDFILLFLMGKIFPQLSFDSIFQGLKINDDSIQTHTLDFQENSLIDIKKTEEKKIYFFLRSKFHLIRNKSVITLTLSFIGFIFLYFISLNYSKIIKTTHLLEQTRKYKDFNPIKSEFPLPKNSILLTRTDLINQIDAVFKGKEKIQTVALTGLGGAGKTTLAREYARGQNSSVIWEFNAETIESLMSSFDDLAFHLAETEEEKRILRGFEEVKKSKDKWKQIVLFVKNKLKNYPKWLLIYDNVEHFSNIQSYFPIDLSWGQGRIIVTTRNSHISNNSHVVKNILVDKLTAKEKLDLFLKIINSGNVYPLKDVTKESLRKFLQDIPSFPLDVSIAAYYLKITGISPIKYIEYLRDQDQNFNSTQENILNETGCYKKTRYNIISFSAKKIINTNKGFLDLLLFICLVDSQNIPKNLLKAYKTETLIDNFLYHLNKYSFLNDNLMNNISEKKFICIHRCIQEISLSYVKQHLNFIKYNELVGNIIDVLDKYTENEIEEENIIYLKLLKIHYEKLYRNLNLFSKIEVFKIKEKLGLIYYYFGDYIKSEKILKEIYINVEIDKNFKTDRLAVILMYLGRCYGYLGQYGDSKKFLTKSLHIYQKYFPLKSDKMALVLSYLGDLYRDLGEYNKAKKILEQSLSIYKLKHPQNQKRIAWISMLLGRIYSEEEKFKEALFHLENSLHFYKKQQSNNQLNLARCLSYLGCVYNDMYNFQKSKILLEQALEIYTKNFPTNYEDIVYCSVILGEVLRRLKKYDNSKIILESALTISKTYFPKNKSRMAWIEIHLGTTEKELNNYKNAVKLLRNGWLVYQEHYGKEHVNTKWALKRLNKALKVKSD